MLLQAKLVVFVNLVMHVTHLSYAGTYDNVNSNQLLCDKYIFLVYYIVLALWLK